MILSVAPSGARKTKKHHPALPLSAKEIGRDAARCREAGAAMIHLHVRDDHGRDSLDPDAFRAAIDAVRREAGNDFLIQISTKAIGIHAPGAQMAVVGDVAPEAFSISIREILPDASLEPVVARFFHFEASRGTLVQYILYDLNDLLRFESLVARGVLPVRNASQLFVLSGVSATPNSPTNALLQYFSVRTIGLPWAVCAFDPHEAGCGALAAALGGHPRVGFENNLFLPGGELAPDNAALVANMARLASTIGRPLASPDAARALFRVS